MQINANEMRKSNEYLYNNFSIPGVIGYIDGTHAKLLKPNNNEDIFIPSS